MSFMKIVTAGIILLFIAAIISYENSQFSRNTVKMNGDTMEPTYSNGDLLKIDNNFSDLKRGDIIMFKLPSEKTDMLLIKRIIGLPEEKIEITSGKILINGTNLSENSYYNSASETTTGSISLQLKSNEYFVLGDNRDKSFDSRGWGALPKENIIAKVIGKR